MKNKKIARMIISCVCVIALLSMSLCTVYAADMTEEDAIYRVEFEVIRFESKIIEHEEFGIVENVGIGIEAYVFYQGQLVANILLVADFICTGSSVYYQSANIYPHMIGNGYIQNTGISISGSTSTSITVSANPVVFSPDTGYIPVYLAINCNTFGDLTPYTSHPLFADELS